MSITITNSTGYNGEYFYYEARSSDEVPTIDTIRANRLNSGNLINLKSTTTYLWTLDSIDSKVYIINLPALKSTYSLSTFTINFVDVISDTIVHSYKGGTIPMGSSSPGVFYMVMRSNPVCATDMGTGLQEVYPSTDVIDTISASAIPSSGNETTTTSWLNWKMMILILVFIIVIVSIIGIFVYVKYVQK